MLFVINVFSNKVLNIITCNYIIEVLFFFQIKMISLLPEQKNHDHLNENIIHLWSCVKDEHPSSFICALIEASIGSETLLKTIIPKVL